jgi:hypothetical protein
MRSEWTLMLKAVFAILAMSGIGLWAQGQYKGGQDLTGSWRLLATIPAGVPVCPGTEPCEYEAMATAISDGTVVQTAAIPNTTIGHGAWKRDGLRTFKMTALYFRVDDTGIQVGTSETEIEAELDTTGRFVTGTFSAVLYDNDQAVVLEYSGTVTGQRIVVP